MISLLLPLKCMANINEISHYEPVFFTAVDSSGKEFIALRSFYIKNRPDYLVVDPYTMKTQTVPQSEIKKTQNITLNRKGNPYLQALNKYTSPPWPLQNQGIKHAQSPLSGSAFMTVDLCPSLRHFDKDFFIRLMKIRRTLPFPLAISVSGRWVEKHEKAFQWLTHQKTLNNLDIVWVNHTYHHRYLPGVNNSQNFLLLTGTDIQKEITENEKILLSRGEVPSIFIRFPGLISDKKVVEATKKPGLIPLGANAWLAKGQPIHDGSVVLVHGNGNEPAGLRMLTDNVLGKINWLPLPLTISYADRNDNNR